MPKDPFIEFLKKTGDDAQRDKLPAQPLSDSEWKSLSERFDLVFASPRIGSSSPSILGTSWLNRLSKSLKVLMRPFVVVPVGAVAAVLMLLGAIYIFRPAHPTQPITLFASITRGGSPPEKVQLELRLKRRTVLFAEAGVYYTGAMIPAASAGPNIEAFELTPPAEGGTTNSLKGELRLIRVEGRQRIRSGRDLSMAILSNGQRRIDGKSWEALPPELVFQPGH